jgi:hypothetical protein
MVQLAVAINNGKVRESKMNGNDLADPKATTITTTDVEEKSQPTGRHCSHKRTLNKRWACPFQARTAAMQPWRATVRKSGTHSPDSVQKRQKPRPGATPYCKGAPASAPRVGRNGRGQHPATREAGDSSMAGRKRCTSPEANIGTPAGTTSSAVEAPTKRVEVHKNGAHSMPGAGAALQEGVRIQEPGHAMRAN